jgi:hypothetical protein
MPQGRFHQDQSGTKIAMLTLLEKTDMRTGNGSYKYRVMCDCGTEKIVGFSQMATGRARSCGCLQKRKGADSPAYKHGRSKTKDYYNELMIRQTYGLEYHEYLSMVDDHKGVCAICGAEPPKGQHKKRLNIDHCHKTGAIRGLLCDCCNRALGLMRDNAQLLSKAIDYLTKYANAR